MQLTGMRLTPHALKAMGFHQIGEGKSISAVFHTAHAYEVQGFVFHEALPISFSGQVAGVPYTVAVGKSINALSVVLFNDDFVEDEQHWIAEHKSTPPYVLVGLGPSAAHVCTEGSEGYFKEEGNKLITYECFSSARDEMRAYQNKVLPALISGLTCSFSTLRQAVRFRPLSSTLFGRSASGKMLHDLRFEMKGSAYVSSTLAIEEVRHRVEMAVGLAARFNPKVSNFLHLALDEEDLLKKFLYFFLSVEIATHATFASIEHPKHLAIMLSVDPRVQESASRFFDAQRGKWNTLGDRFVWCAICVWSHFTDEDIREFFRLKRIRDDIAHGSIAAPPAEAVTAIKKMAIRLHDPNVTPGA